MGPGHELPQERPKWLRKVNLPICVTYQPKTPPDLTQPFTQATPALTSKLAQLEG